MRPASRIWSVVAAAVFALLVGALFTAPVHAATTAVVPGAALSSVTGSATTLVVAKKNKKKSKKAKKRARRLAQLAAAAQAAHATPVIPPGPAPTPTAAPTSAATPTPGPTPTASPSPTPAPTPTESPSPTPATCGVPVYRADGSERPCTFSDDFDGTSLDSAKWVPLSTDFASLGRGNGDCWTDDPDNVSVSGGTLKLVTRKEANTCQDADGTSFKATHTSGTVSTFAKFAQAYGRWEIRARFPQMTVPGSQSALWLWPKNRTTTWPASGEIDIAEFYTYYPDRVIPYVHYVPANPDDRTVKNNYCFISDPWAFHTYTLEWYPGRITITFDDQTCIDHVIDPAAPLTGSAPFDKPFFLILSQFLGSGLNSPTTATPSVMTTQIDYVRVWGQ